jgi:hypothetical protein
MYSYGLVQFLQAKKLKSNECINAFLKSENVSEFTAKNHNRVNIYIEKHWNKFASFVDRGIKNGDLKGKPVKLNHHFDEQRERNERIKKEFQDVNLNSEQQRIINEIKKDGVGKFQSAMMKEGINPVGKDYAFESKTLQWLPLVNQIIENNILTFKN